MRRNIRVSVDIGGTFTDLECADEDSGQLYIFKTPTTPEDPSIGLANAITGAAARYGFDPADITFLIHGTTIATNAVLTRDLPEGALITTAGFEDVLEIGRHARRNVYALTPEQRTVLIPRSRRFGVTERIGADGTVHTSLTLEPIDHVIDAVLASGATVVAICLLNAFVDPSHEMMIRDRLRERAPHLPLSCSHEISPEIREFERTSTTVLNALLMPVVGRYVAGLEKRKTEIGFSAPLYLVQSNGGATTPASAALGPARLLLSGPSGGVLAAERLAGDLGITNAIAVDMGGTSYDVSIIQDGKRAVVTAGEVDGCPVRLPMVDMRTIGAGGGSIVFVDPYGRLQVGPRSAGAKPGPVCYRRGGTEPTVTDVNVVLGRLDPDAFFGGELALDVEAARQALETRVAQPLGLGVEELSEGVLAIVVATFASAIKLSLFERGLDPRDFALISFGGAGGLHAVETADELGITKVIFPREPSTFSAHGILQSDIVHDLARARILPLARPSVAALNALAQELRQEGKERLMTDGLPESRQKLELHADLRYRGQAFELTVPVGANTIDAGTISDMADRFHDLHKQRFSFNDPAEPIEVVTMRLAAIGRLGNFAGAPLAASGQADPKQWRCVYLKGLRRDVPVYEQATLGPGTALSGPAIIAQAYTTLLVTDDWTLHVAASGDLIAERNAS